MADKRKGKKKKINKKTNKYIRNKILILIGIFVLVVGISYALFTITLSSKRMNKLFSGKVSLRLTDANGLEEDDGYGIYLENTYPMEDIDGMENSSYYEFNLVNDGKTDVTYSLYLDDLDLEEGETRLDDRYVRYNFEIDGVVKDSKNITDEENRLLYSGRINKDKTMNFKLRLWLNIETPNSEMEKVFASKIRVEGVQAKESNPYITAVYNYVESGEYVTSEDGKTITYNPGRYDCITGEEPTCVPSECIYDNKKGSCEPGTIIKYQVNDEEEKYFYVLHDDGNKITLQQRGNTISGTVRWVKDGGSASIDGPNNAIEKLNEGISNWTNVKEQKYTMGVTQFIESDNPNINNWYTKCDSNGICSKNTYVWSERIDKARMITIQESINLGCSSDSAICPRFLTSGSYWTMTTGASSFSVWLISGKASPYGMASQTYGVRAVIVIDK